MRCSLRSACGTVLSIGLDRVLAGMVASVERWLGAGITVVTVGSVRGAFVGAALHCLEDPRSLGNG